MHGIEGHPRVESPGVASSSFLHHKDVHQGNLTYNKWWGPPLSSNGPSWLAKNKLATGGAKGVPMARALPLVVKSAIELKEVIPEKHILVASMVILKKDSSTPQARKRSSSASKAPGMGITGVKAQTSAVLSKMSSSSRSSTRPNISIKSVSCP